MLPRWTAEKVGGSYGMISPGSQRNVSNELRPQDPSSGDVWLTASRAEICALQADTYGRRGGCEEYAHFPLTRGLDERPVLLPAGVAGSRSTQQSDGQHIGAVKVSAVLVDVTPELVEEPVPTGTTGYDVTSLANAGMASSAVLAGGVTVGVILLAIAGVAYLADAWVASLAELDGGVTVGVASPAVAGVASLANAGVASLADAGVASLAIAGVASLAVAGVASLADFAEVASSADIAGSVTVGVTFLADPVGIV